MKECVKTRSSAQIRSHAQKYIIKLCKKFGINENKQLKNFKNIKRKSSDTNLLGIENINELDKIEDFSKLDMEIIEEKILGIFKSNSVHAKT